MPFGAVDFGELAQGVGGDGFVGDGVGEGFAVVGEGVEFAPEGDEEEGDADEDGDDGADELGADVFCSVEGAGEDFFGGVGVCGAGVGATDPGVEGVVVFGGDAAVVFGEDGLEGGEACWGRVDPFFGGEVAGDEDFFGYGFEGGVGCGVADFAVVDEPGCKDEEEEADAAEAEGVFSVDGGFNGCHGDVTLCLGVGVGGWGGVFGPAAAEGFVEGDEVVEGCGAVGDKVFLGGEEVGLLGEDVLYVGVAKFVAALGCVEGFLGGVAGEDEVGIALEFVVVGVPGGFGFLVGFEDGVGVVGDGGLEGGFFSGDALAPVAEAEEVPRKGGAEGEVFGDVAPGGEAGGGDADVAREGEFGVEVGCGNAYRGGLCADGGFGGADVCSRAEDFVGKADGELFGEGHLVFCAEEAFFHGVGGLAGEEVKAELCCEEVLAEVGDGSAGAGDVCLGGVEVVGGDVA